MAIEALHHTRDVTSGEDRSTVRTGSGPQVMAALRNFTIGVFGMIRRNLGKRLDFPVLFRHFSRSRDCVFNLLGLQTPQYAGIDTPTTPRSPCVFCRSPPSFPAPSFVLFSGFIEKAP